MKLKRHIIQRLRRQFLAGMLLLIFCIGITPKQVLHDLFADHKHLYSPVSQHLTVDLKPVKFNCDFHNQVAESPFLETDFIRFDHAAVPVFIPRSHQSSPLPLNPALHTDLRGPPAVA